MNNSRTLTDQQLVKYPNSDLVNSLLIYDRFKDDFLGYFFSIQNG